MSITIAIQAGGQSTRMGTNKAVMPFLGAPLIERVRTRLQPLASEMLVISNTTGELDFLGLPVLPDIVQGKGVLGGLLTAVSAASQPFVAVVACDMPFANPALIRAELNLMEAEKVDVVIPRSGQGLEPLHALYRRETCLPAILKAVESEQRRLISFFPDVKVREMQLEEVMSFDPSELAFLNINTPEDFQKAEEIARRNEIGA